MGREELPELESLFLYKYACVNHSSRRYKTSMYISDPLVRVAAEINVMFAPRVDEKTK